MKDELGIEVELIEGDAGVFNVVADGEMVFSKHSEGRFPDHQEVVDELRKQLLQAISVEPREKA